MLNNVTDAQITKTALIKDALRLINSRLLRKNAPCALARKREVTNSLFLIFGRTILKTIGLISLLLLGILTILLYGLVNNINKGLSFIVSSTSHMRTSDLCSLDSFAQTSLD